MKKILSILTLTLISLLGYSQTMGVRSGSSGPVYTVNGANAMFATRVSLNNLTTQINTLTTQLNTITITVNNQQALITKLTSTTIAQQKQIDSLMNYRIIVIPPLRTTANSDTLYWKP